jgi:hypothetical protein
MALSLSGSGNKEKAVSPRGWLHKGALITPMYKSQKNQRLIYIPPALNF